MYCKNCGSIIDDESKVCLHCGEKENFVSTETNRTIEIKVVEEQIKKENKKTHTVFKVFSIIGLVCALIPAIALTVLKIMGNVGKTDENRLTKILIVVVIFSIILALVGLILSSVSLGLLKSKSAMKYKILSIVGLCISIGVLIFIFVSFGKFF